DNLDLVDRLSEYAYKDVLVGLPNRNALAEEIDKVMPRSVRERGSNDYVLVVVDLNNFAEINASLGQDYGDGILKAVAMRLSEKFYALSKIARVGGDVFAVLGESGEINEQSILAVFAQPFVVDGEE